MVSRRTCLKTATAGLAGLAGCSGTSSNPEDDDQTTTEAQTPSPTEGPGDTEGEDQTSTPTQTPSKTPALETPTTPVPEAAPGTIPTKKEFRAQYTRFTKVEQSLAEVEIVGADIKADYDGETADVTLLATNLLAGKDADDSEIYDRVSRRDVPIPNVGERGRLAFDINLPDDSNSATRIQYYLFVREPGAELSESIQVCESNVYDARGGDFKPAQESDVFPVLEDRSEAGYRRYTTEGYLLIAVKTATLDGNEFVFKYPVFLSTFYKRLLDTRRRTGGLTLEEAHQYNTERSGYRRALQQAAPKETDRSMLLTGLAVFRSLPGDLGFMSRDNARGIERTLIDGGPRRAGRAMAISAAATFADYDAALLDATNTISPMIAGDFTGYSLTANGTEYFYIEPSARLPIGGISDRMRRSILTDRPTPLSS